MRIVDYTDEQGIPHRVALPEGVDLPLDEGLPVSMNLDMLYQEMPPDFRAQFYKALWEFGLITPCDYLQPGASDKFRRALTSAIRTDFFDILALAREACKK